MDIKDVYKNSIIKWGNNKGIGTVSYDSALDLFIPIKEVLNKFFAHNNFNTAIIVVPNNARMDEWTTKLVKDFNHIEKIGSDALMFLTADNIIFNKIKLTTDLLIFDQIDKFYNGERLEIVKGKYITTKFKLGVTNSPDPDQDTFGLYDACPVIDRVTKVDIVTHGILDNTVEFNIPSKLNDSDAVMYKEYGTFIADTIEIFGNFDNVMKCYMGDTKMGISADHFRIEIATSKGWHKDIDTSTTYYANIDRYFNPNSLYERAKSFTEVIRKRKNLLNNNFSKIDIVLDIIEKYKDKKILIINKAPVFARTLSEAINDKIENDNLKFDKPQGTLFKPVEKNKGFTITDNFICIEYHNDVKSRPLIDIDTNDFIRYKSGIKAGTIKTFGAKSLNNIANDRFNKGYHNVMSSVNAIPKDADLEIDFIIITSPECDTINTFQYRVHRLSFKENIKIVNIYLKNTKEDKKLRDKQSLNKNKIINVTNIESELIL